MRIRLSGTSVARRWRLGLAAAAVGTLVVGMAGAGQAAAPDFEVQPIDPQNWKNQYDMTWDDWTDIPGTEWNDPDALPSERGLRIALVAVDFPDQPFDMTQEKNSDLFGNPQIDP